MSSLCVRAIKTFCTPLAFHPHLAADRRSRLARRSQVDSSLQQHLLGSIEIFDVDAAADEQKAGRLLAGQVGLTVNKQAPMPNLRAIVRDCTHASGRTEAPEHLAACVAFTKPYSDSASHWLLLAPFKIKTTGPLR